LTSSRAARIGIIVRQPPSRSARGRRLTRVGLIDESRIVVCPTIVGGGRSLFPTLPGYVNLRRVNARTYDTGVVFLHYEPQR